MRRDAAPNQSLSQRAALARYFERPRFARLRFGPPRAACLRAAVCLLMATIALVGCDSANPVAVEPADDANSGPGSSQDGKVNSSAANQSTNGGSGTAQSGTGANSASNSATAEAEAVIQRMAEAYQSAQNYMDAAVFQYPYDSGGGQLELAQVPISVAYEAPNKIRIHHGENIVFSDGANIFGAYYGAGGYVAEREAPDALTPADVFFDPYLLFPGLQVPPQLSLLTEDGVAERMLSQSAVRAELLEPMDLDDFTCDRVRFVSRAVFEDQTIQEYEEIHWIDQDSHILRRIEYQEQRSIEFTGARLNAAIGPEVFELDLAGAARVKRFVGPSLAESLGKKPAAFDFTGLDGEAITQDSLMGQVVLLDFWLRSADVPAADDVCLNNFPRLESLQEKYADNDSVRILSVNIDPAATPEAVRAVLQEQNANLPMAIDGDDADAWQSFGCGSVPYAFILSPDGVVQYCEMGYGTAPGDDPVARLSEKIDAILAGESLAEAMLAEFEQAMMSEAPEVTTTGSPQYTATLAPASEPETVILEPLWTAEVAEAGNILVVGTGDSAAILAFEGYKGLAEISKSGEVINRPDLKLKDEQVVTIGRTAEFSGKQYFVLFAEGMSQACVYDDAWNLVLEYPPAETEHPGIAEAQLIALDQSETPQLAVGFFNIVGIHVVDLNGDRMWDNRTLSDVTSIISTTTPIGIPVLLCCHTSSGGMAEFRSGGTREDDVFVEGKFVREIVAAELLGDGFDHYCGLAFDSNRNEVAVGFTSTGDELWSLPLPPDTHNTLEQIGWGHLVGDKPHWIIAGTDGSLRFVAPGGKLLDSMAAGKQVNGFAATNIDGAPVLLLSTSEGVEAWKVTPK